MKKNGGQGQRKREMGGSHSQSDRDGSQFGVTAEAAPQESCLCR